MTRWHGDMSSLQYSYHISPLWHVTSLKPSSFFWRDNHGPQMARSHGNEAVYGPAGHCRADDLTTWSSPRIDVFLLVKNPEFRYVSEGFNYFNGCFWQIENSWVSGANSILFFLGCSPPKRGRPKHQKKRIRCALRPVNQGTFHLWENSTCRSWIPPNRLCPGGRLGSLKSEVAEKMGKNPCLFTFKVSGRSSLQFRGGVFQVSMWNHMK